MVQAQSQIFFFPGFWEVPEKTTCLHEMAHFAQALQLYNQGLELSCYLSFYDLFNVGYVEEDLRGARLV